jgi:hypothetical protein
MKRNNNNHTVLKNGHEGEPAHHHRSGFKQAQLDEGTRLESEYLFYRLA